MKRSTKALAVIPLALAMVFPTVTTASTTVASAPSANFNPTGMPIVKQAVTKKYMMRRPPNINSPEQLAVLKYYEKISNVKVEWEVVSSDGFTERVNLAMASNDMPEAIIKGVPDIVKASASGAIIDMKPLFDKYSVGMKKLFEENPSVKTTAFTADGKLYAVPQINTLEPNRTAHRNIWINNTWLTKLSLKMPTTTDEYLNVLRAFKDKDPNGNGKNDEIPYVVEDSSGAKNGRIDIISGFFGVYSNLGYDRIKLYDNKVSFLPFDPAYKETLQYMNLMYKEKLMDNEVFTQTPDASLSKFAAGNAGSFGLSSDDLFTKVSSNYVAMPPVKSPNGRTPVIALGSPFAGNAAVITKADKNPEITFRYLDYFFTPEGANMVGCFAPGLEGQTCEKLPDGSYDYTKAMLTDSRGVAVAVGDACPLPGGGFPYWRNENNSNYIYSAIVRKNVAVWNKFYQKDPAFGYPVFTTDVQQKVSDIRKDLDIYINECQAKFITGELSFDKWDEYISTIKKMKAEELVGYFQTAYNAMSK